MKNIYHSIINFLANNRIRIGTKKYPVMILFVVFLLLLMPLLAWFQYQWLGQLSEGEKERLRASLKFASNRMAEDFDRELSEPFRIFRKVFVESESKDNYYKLISAYNSWKSETKYPSLVKSIYFVSGKSSSEDFDFQKMDTVLQKMVSENWPSYFSVLKNKLFPLTKDKSATVYYAVHGLIVEEYPFIVISNFPFQLKSISDALKTHSEKPSYTILELDRSILSDHLIPDLTKTYFIKDNVIDYNIGIYNADQTKFLFKSDSSISDMEFKSVDLETPIANLKTQDFIFSSLPSPELFFQKSEINETLNPSGNSMSVSIVTSGKPSTDIIKKQNSTRNKKQASGYSYSYSTHSTSTVFSEKTTERDLNILNSVPSKNTTIKIVTLSDQSLFQDANSTNWKLGIRHHDGSLENAVSNVRTRNLLISFSILLVLGLSILLVAISANRSQELAHQQMEFVATVSHELRTPLAVIRSAAENLSDGVVSNPEQSKNYGSLILNQGRRLSEMVEQVLEYSGIQSQKMNYNFQLTETVSFLNQVADEFLLTVPYPDMVLNKEIDPFIPSLTVDRNSIKSVLFNLFSNAIKYSKDNKIITLKAVGTDNSVIIKVIDNGIGIQPMDLPFLFDPFYRGKNTQDDQIQGSGLGLSLVKNIIENHYGKVSVESTVGVGSVFTIEIPIKQRST